MTANFTEELVQVGGTKIQLFKGGAGDPLLLLHGAGGNRGWLRYVQSLAEQYTVYLPTHPGFGASERPDWIQNMQDLACFYTWFQEEQGLEGARCIGFSMGGWLAAEMAVRLCWKPYMHDLRLPTLLARVRLPTRIVWGREDRLVPAECGQLYQKAIPGSDLVIVEGCGHSPQIEKREEFAQTALEFLGA